ncbi:MAG: dTMP kinase [Desulfobacteraceae bacterium 4484_190.3]|nr:MAG: dTMP kinase [Desulfobacteraceae bacterium 4484_190.3]
MGLFVTFEGSEGSGKTTQIKKAGDYLSKKKVPFTITEEPGGTQLGNELRKLLLNKTSLNITRKSELLLFAAARAQHVKEIILPAINDGKVVLCDRYSDATIAYQAFGRGLKIEDVQWINGFSSQSLKPELTLLFDIPVDIGLERAMSRISQITDSPAEDRFEGEDLQFHMRVRRGYFTLVKNEPERFRVIDASKEIHEVHREVCFHLDKLIKDKRLRAKAAKPQNFKF